MQRARVVEVMRGKSDVVLMAGTVVVSRQQRAGADAEEPTGRCKHQERASSQKKKAARKSTESGS